MREIKFRAYVKDTNKVLPVYSLDFSGLVDECITVASCGDLDCGMCLDFYKIEDVELMQFTGLKDKNGREIYEGDVVKRIETSGYTFVGEVIYEECGFGIKPYRFFTPLSTKGKYDDGQSSFDYLIEYEVIGNIHDNPELIG